MSQQINLFSPVFLRQEKYFSAKAMAQALGLIAIGLAAFYGYAKFQSGVVERAAAEVDQQHKQVHEQLAAVVTRTAAGTSALLASEASHLEKVRENQKAILASLRGTEFGSEMGFSAYFEAFARRTLGGLWLTGFSVGGGGNELVVQGRAVRADLLPPYLARLNEEDVMRGRKVTEMRLAAKEEKPAEGTPSTKAVHYVEFTMIAPRTIAAVKPAPLGAKP